MAGKKSSENKSDSKSLRNKQTVRERTQTSANAKPRRLRGGAGKIRGGAQKAASFGRREYHLPLPDNKAGRLLKKRVKIRFVPKFIRDAWAEIRLVIWPGRRETTRLTFAVLVFSIIFGASVALLDVGLDRLFKEVIIKK